MIRRYVPGRLLLGGLLVLAFFASLPGAVPGQTPQNGPKPSRDQKIAEIEKQLEALQKQLEELRRAEARAAQPAVEGTLPDDWVKGLKWRSIGPAAMGGRIVALSVFAADPTTFWVATASGGLLKKMV